MAFRTFMLIMDLLIPLAMIYSGHRFEKNPPKEINATSGYRTNMSMKNQETWKFAHKYFGKLWKVCGWIILPISVAVMLFAFRKDIINIGIIGGVVCSVQIVVIICTMILTEIALRKNFNKNGNRY
ncbi:MAG: SdpI family protein [Clostridiales bacterium]|nr:SdpI family protein [Clostridiales bacterium]